MERVCWYNFGIFKGLFRNNKVMRGVYIDKYFKSYIINS